jgi:hypothetical protein
MDVAAVREYPLFPSLPAFNVAALSVVRKFNSLVSY